MDLYYYFCGYSKHQEKLFSRQFISHKDLVNDESTPNDDYASVTQVYLTRVNCMICLVKFNEEDIIVKMGCDKRHHWTHKHCFLEKCKTNVSKCIYEICRICEKAQPESTFEDLDQV